MPTGRYVRIDLMCLLKPSHLKDMGVHRLA